MGEKEADLGPRKSAGAYGRLDHGEQAVDTIDRRSCNPDCPSGPLFCVSCGHDLRGRFRDPGRQARITTKWAIVPTRA